METSLYIDVIFVLQGAMHCFLLYCADKLSGYAYRNIFYLFLGGFVASLCHILWLVIFFPKTGGLLLSCCILTLAILICFLPKTIQQFTRIFIASIFASFLLGGGMNVMFMTGEVQKFLGEGVVVKPITFPWYYLIWGTCIGYIFIKKCSKWVENHITYKQNFCSIILEKGGKTISAYTLIDTGNSLKYENQPIIIIEFATLMNLFSHEECVEILQGNRELLTPFSFSSLGNNSDKLWGFKADKCILSYGNTKIIYSDFWIGIQFDSFVGGFDGIVPPNIVKEVIL